MQRRPDRVDLCRQGLSVSSVGSEAMQRALGLKFLLLSSPFSILGRIGGDATLPAGKVLLRAGRAFSILGRIGGDATEFFVYVYSTPPLVFQYPRSDRRRCNSRGGCRPPPPNLPFSILGRIGGDATLAFFVVASSALLLSVSSVGSEAMQPCRRARGHAAHLSFQYPRSDRRRCNGGCGRTRLRQRSPFSILGRIGGDATSLPAWILAAP